MRLKSFAQDSELDLLLRSEVERSSGCTFNILCQVELGYWLKL